MMSLGTRDVQVISVTVNDWNGDAEMKPSYTVTSGGVRAMGGEILVAYHAQLYPYRDKSKVHRWCWRGMIGRR